MEAQRTAQVVSVSTNNLTIDGPVEVPSGNGIALLVVLVLVGVLVPLAISGAALMCRRQRMKKDATRQ